MSSTEQGLVEVDRVKIVKAGGALYFVVPKFLRRKYDIRRKCGGGYDAVFLSISNHGPIIIHIEKRSDGNKQYINRYPANLARTVARQNGFTLTHCVWPGCKVSEKIHAHHPDYSKPNEIIPLCSKHHGRWHKMKGKLGFDLPVIDISSWLTRAPNSEQTVIKIEQIEVSQ